MVVIYGKVIERFTKKPVIGATVSMAGDTKYTDASGGFSLDVPYGDYPFIISHPQYRLYSTNLTINKQINSIGVIAIDSIVRAL
jgi:hypothetical protein